MSDERDRRLLRHYAAANAALDEAPSEAARAAILAAAARAAGARPQLAGRPRKWRLPLAAAASLLVGTVAVLLATRFDHAPPEDLATPPPVAPFAMPPREADPAARSEAGPAPAQPVLADERPSPKAGATAPLRKEAPAAAQARHDAGHADAARALATAEPDAAPATSIAAPAAPAAKPTDAVETRPPAAAAMPQRLNERAADAGEAARAAPALPAPWRAAPEAWVEYIVKLRGEGRHDEADAELVLLRRQHPDLRPPPAALPPTGR